MIRMPKALATSCVQQAVGIKGISDTQSVGETPPISSLSPAPSHTQSAKAMNKVLSNRNFMVYTACGEESKGVGNQRYRYGFVQRTLEDFSGIGL